MNFCLRLLADKSGDINYCLWIHHNEFKYIESSMSAVSFSRSLHFSIRLIMISTDSGSLLLLSTKISLGVTLSTEQIATSVTVLRFVPPLSMSAYVLSDISASAATSAWVRPLYLLNSNILFPICLRSVISIIIPPIVHHIDILLPKIVDKQEVYMYNNRKNSPYSGIIIFNIHDYR